MSSSESEDENLKKFAESVDTSVFSNNLYNGEKVEEEPKVELKSQRNLEHEENVFQSEVNVSETMQNFVGKKLSKLIEDQIEFVEKEETFDDAEEVNALRLLRGSKQVVKLCDDFIENRKKVPIKRRKIDNDDEPEESEKIKSSAIKREDITEETKSWANKSKHKAFEFKSKRGIGYLRDPTNEFTERRNKNAWNESKIKTAKLHSGPICDSIKK